MDDNLVAFLNARLDEDEAIARAAAGEAPAPWSADGKYLLDAARQLVALDENVSYEETFPHLARHDPARVLREVEAARKVLEWYADSAGTSVLLREKLGTGTHMAVAAESYLNMIRALAAICSGHPDYRQEWAP